MGNFMGKKHHGTAYQDQSSEHSNVRLLEVTNETVHIALAIRLEG